MFRRSTRKDNNNNATDNNSDSRIDNKPAGRRRGPLPLLAMGGILRFVIEVRSALMVMDLVVSKHQIQMEQVTSALVKETFIQDRGLLG
jgi:hypothetical protein